jgi:hypothetical protein
MLRADVLSTSQVLQRLLGSFGVQHNVHRVYVFELDSERKKFSNTAEWCSEGTKPYIDQLQNKPFEWMPYLIPLLLSGQIFKMNSLDELPIEATSERDEFIKEGIQSLLLAPIFALNTPKVIGFLGFDSLVPRKWEDNHIYILETAIEVVMGMKLSQIGVEANDDENQSKIKCTYSTEERDIICNSVIEEFELIRLRSGDIDQFCNF